MSWTVAVICITVRLLRVCTLISLINTNKTYQFNKYNKNFIDKSQTENREVKLRNLFSVYPEETVHTRFEGLMQGIFKWGGAGGMAQWSTAHTTLPEDLF